MSDVISDAELNALAAEYVLGTLDYEERQGANALLEVDHTFRGIVRIWERRFGDLHLMVEAVEPDPLLWERIRSKAPGIEQVSLAIPSHADKPTIVPLAPAPDHAALPPVAAADIAVDENDAPPHAAETASAKPQADAPPLNAAMFDKPLVDAPGFEQAAPVVSDTVPDADAATDASPIEAQPAAVTEAELKLAELAALLPVTGEHKGVDGEHKGALHPEMGLEDGLHTHAPDVVPRGFVPPAPMSTRGSPAVVEVPVPVLQKAGRGWIAATSAMGLVAVVLAGLIGAWRYFPERLPASLRAYSVLNLSPPVQPPAPAPKARPKPPSFDE